MIKGKYASFSHVKFTAVLNPAYIRAREKKNSIENSSRFEKKCSAEAVIMVAALNENHRTGFVSGKFIRRPSQVKTRKRRGRLLFIQKPFPF